MDWHRRMNGYGDAYETSYGSVDGGGGVGGTGLGDALGWDALRVYSFLFDLVDQHLLPRFPKERAGGHLEVAVHASVLIRQAVDGIVALGIPMSSAPAYPAGGGEREIRPLEPFGAQLEARIRASQVRKQLVQLVDKLLSLLQLWGPREVSSSSASDVASGEGHVSGRGGGEEEEPYAAHGRIASSLVRRELYVSFLALVTCLAEGGEGGGKVQVGTDVEEVLMQRRDQVLPIALTDALSQLHFEEERETQLLSLQALLYLLPLSPHRRSSQIFNTSGGGGGQSMMGTPTKSSLLFSRASKVGGRTSSRAAPPLPFSALLQKYALVAHLAADFAGKTPLPDVLHHGLDQPWSPLLQEFVAKVELLKAIAAHPLGCHELRQTGLVQTICASTLISSAMSTDSRAHVLLRPDTNSSAMPSAHCTSSFVEMHRAHRLV